jgi:hypothetical protein
MDGDNTNKQGSWWTTLPGILTALAALITAITGFYVALSPHRDRPAPDPCTSLPVDERPISCLGSGK